MLIMTAAALEAGASRELAERNFDLLEKWADYLVRHGMHPENQLCTDDFAGHLAGNVNLTVKAMVGIACFARICRRLGKPQAEPYEGHARTFAAAVERAAQGVLPLAYGMEGSYSLKYNLLFDKLLGFGLIGQEVLERETEEYCRRGARYGVPLDVRARYTKSDWILWCAALTDDADKRQALYAPVLRYLRESPSRYPFGDWYDADSGAIENFINRTVQGGIFAPLLLEAFGKGAR